MAEKANRKPNPADHRNLRKALGSRTSRRAGTKSRARKHSSRR